MTSKEYNRKYYLDHKLAHNAKSKAWAAAHKDEIKTYNRRWHLRKNYDLSEEDVDVIFNAQGRKCPICQKEVINKNVDHNSKTNEVRGILCWDCNIGLGKFRHDPDCLIRAATYLAWATREPVEIIAS